MARYSSTNNNLHLNVYLDQGAQDISSNSTVVHYRVTVSRTPGYTSYNQQGDSVLTVDVNGQRIHHSNPRWRTSGEEAHLVSGEVRVGHNADGTKSVPISATFHANNGFHGPVTTSGSLQLSTIPRSSTLTFGRATIGSPLTITINRAVEGFTHTLRWAWGTKSGHIADNVATSHIWTVPENLATEIPGATTGNGIILVDTFNGGQQIGTQSFRLDADLPDRFRPTLTGFTLTDSNTATARLIPGEQHFVQILSNITVNFGQSAGVHGSTITGYHAEIVDRKQVTTSNGGRLGMMQFSGDVTIRAKVQDSRGRWSNTIDKRVTVLPYHAPILKFRVLRTGADSSTLTVIRTATIAPLIVSGVQKNTMRLSFKTATYGSDQFVADTGPAGENTNKLHALEESERNLSGTFRSDKSYRVLGSLSDAFTSVEIPPAEVLETVGPEQAVHAYDKDGRFSVGQIPEMGPPGSLNVAGDIYSRGNLIQHHQVTRNDGKCISISTGPDSITTTGFYYLKNGPNTPMGINGYLLVQAYEDSRYILQEYTNVLDGRKFERLLVGGAWTTWKAPGLDQFYPVGAIYQSTNATDPATLMGGTWQRFGNGRVLVGVDEADGDFNSANKIGGSKTHTLTEREMPSHSHGQHVTANDGGTSLRRDYSSDGRGTVYDQGVQTMTAGGGQAHNNMQPYVTVYRWRRTA